MTENRSALADALRAWRDRVTPAAAGMPTGGERRVPGLRREELAALAGLSVDYVVRLEQGRAVNPSPQVIASIARALRLTTDERDILYRLAGAVEPPSGLVSRHVPPGIQRMTDRLVDTPVAVYTASWDIIQWNTMWAALLGDPSALSHRDRNLLWRHFTGDRTRVLQDAKDIEAFERETVAELRVAHGRYPDDPELASLVEDLSEQSPAFRALWDRFEVAPRISQRKTVKHPLVGQIVLDCDVLTAAGSDLRVIVYTAEPGSTDAGKIDLLRVTGMQELVV